ncbi:MAG TPA: tetratricopeptide repeat protein [Gammaproteobacteria bacterium]|nr:tetratricopeptide repeat protein [Gammaproteobacteria bacterium]
MSVEAVNKLLDEGFALVDKGMLQHALPLFEQATELDEKNAETWMMQGAIKGELGAVQDALACLGKAVLLDPDYAEAHHIQCKILQSQGRLDEAESSGRKAVESDPAYGDAWLTLGAVCGLAGHLEEAEACCRRAVELLPDSMDARNNLANLLKLQGRGVQAIPLYQEILARNPVNAEVNYNLGVALQEQGKLEEAEHCYSRAVTNNPDFAAAYSSLGDVLLKQQKIPEALQYCSKAVEIDPSSADAQIRLGSVLSVSGSEEKRRLLECLEEDHVYTDTREPMMLASELSGLYSCEDDTARESLVRLFSEFDSGEVYPSSWWLSALQRFGPRELAHDKIARGVMSSVYSWSIPTKEVLGDIVRFTGDGGISSYGSGRGYWEYLLQTGYGVDVLASDTHLRHRFVEMQKLDYADADVHKADTVFLSWVPDGVSSAEGLLDKMRSGQRLVLVGVPADKRGAARICATSRFFTILVDRFRHQATVPLVQFAYIDDVVEFYVKN